MIANGTIFQNGIFNTVNTGNTEYKYSVDQQCARISLLAMMQAGCCAAAVSLEDAIRFTARLFC